MYDQKQYLYDRKQYLYDKKTLLGSEYPNTVTLFHLKNYPLVDVYRQESLVGMMMSANFASAGISAAWTISAHSRQSERSLQNIQSNTVAEFADGIMGVFRRMCSLGTSSS